MLSGIAGVILNILLIPQYGLVGVGIATLSANILYFLLSIIIVLPGLRLIYPVLIINRIIISIMPCILLYYTFANIGHVQAIFEMLILLGVFYGIYFTLAKTIMKRPESD